MHDNPLGQGWRNDDGQMRGEEWDRWVAAVVGGGEDNGEEEGIVELPVANVSFSAKYQFTP